MTRTNIKATKAYKLGNSGENKVLLMLNSINDPQYNIHNIMLKDDKGNTHQIDLICITSAGVFVIEVKNVCGYKIYGENDSKYWTYDWIKNKEVIKCKLYNPILQNRTHVQEIRKILKDFNVPIYSMVTFSNNNVIVHQNDLDDMVVSLKNIKNHLNLFPQNKLSETAKNAIKNTILKAHHPEITLQEHINNIQK